jgi:hypothetical protein
LKKFQDVMLTVTTQTAEQSLDIDADLSHDGCFDGQRPYPWGLTAQ